MGLTITPINLNNYIRIPDWWFKKFVLLYNNEYIEYYKLTPFHFKTK